jgi:putative membrane protein
MQGVLAQSIRGIDDFLVYLAAALVLLVIYVWIYVRVTPYREIQLIREGNAAAACGLAGAMIGFVIPLSSAITHSVAFVDMLLWGAIALVVQLVAFLFARWLVPSLPTDIPAGKISAGIFVGSIAIAVGILNAACMTY